MRVENGRLLGITSDDINEGRCTVPENVTCIGFCAFYNWTSLTAITIPEGVASIGNGAFRECTSLTAITIPESVTSIGEQAFLGCTSLTAITIPKGVASIKKDAFYRCESLLHIVVDGNPSEFSRTKALLSPELRSKVVSKQHYLAVQANQNFQLNCFIAISASSAIFLTALVIAMTVPAVATAAGFIAATSSVVALTSCGLYANNRQDSDVLTSYEDAQEAQP